MLNYLRSWKGIYWRPRGVGYPERTFELDAENDRF